MFEKYKYSFYKFLNLDGEWVLDDEDNEEGGEKREEEEWRRWRRRGFFVWFCLF